MGLIGQGIGFRDEGVGGGSLESWVYWGGGYWGERMAVSIKRTIGYIPASAQRSFSRISFVYFLSNVVLTSELIIISC